MRDPRDECRADCYKDLPYKDLPYTEIPYTDLPYRELPAADRLRSSLDSVLPSEEEELERRGSRGARGLSDLLQIQVQPVTATE